MSAADECRARAAGGRADSESRTLALALGAIRHAADQGRRRHMFPAADGSDALVAALRGEGFVVTVNQATIVVDW